MPIVASYNIHSCVGRDGKHSPQRIVDVLRELDADIIALQEVEAERQTQAPNQPEKHLDQWLYLARELGYFCTPGISLRTHRRDYGNALLTRAPVGATRLHDLSILRREPRGAIEIELPCGEHGMLRVIATHLGLRIAERRAQIGTLLALLKSSPTPTLLLGDLNEWHANSRNLRALRRPFHASPAPATFPAGRPFLALDRILAAGAVRISEIAAHRSRLARDASDHLPLRAAFEWVGG